MSILSGLETGVAVSMNLPSIRSKDEVLMGQQFVFVLL